MADSGEKAAEKLREVTECSICMSAFTDPRMLPCIHTFCFNCLFRTGETEQKKPGDKIPCPLCRKEFTIPSVEGMDGLQRNFFIENLTELNKMLQKKSKSTLCDICKAFNEGDSVKIPEATVRCLECRDNFCDRCSQVHKVQKLSKTHKILKIGSETQEEIRRVFSAKSCSKHIQKPLDYYCAECKKIVCVSCFVESHKLHDCKDVTTIEEEFRQTIEKHSLKISTFANEMLSMRKYTEMRKADFLREIEQKENAIHKRSEELKSMIDEHSISLLDELSIIKSNHLKEIGNEMEEVDRCITILRSFESYCTTLRSKGSASDICSSVDEIVTRADELHKDYKEFIRRPLKSVDVSFQVTDLQEVYEKSNRNILGQIKASPSSSNRDKETNIDGPSYVREDMTTHSHSSEKEIGQLPSSSNCDEENGPSYVKEDMTTHSHSSEKEIDQLPSSSNCDEENGPSYVKEDMTTHSHSLEKEIGQLPSSSNCDEENGPSYVNEDMTTHSHSLEKEIGQLPSSSNCDEESGPSDVNEDMTTHSRNSENIMSDGVEPIPSEHQSSIVASCLDCGVDLCIECLLTTHDCHRTIDKDILLQFEGELSTLSGWAEEILSQIFRFQKGKEDIMAAAESTSQAILHKYSEIKDQLERDEKKLQLQLQLQKIKKLNAVESVYRGAQRYQQKITDIKTELKEILSMGPVEEIYNKMKNYELNKSSLEKDKDCYIRQTVPSLAILFREKETKDNALGNLEELTEERQSEATVLPARSKPQTIKSYARLLNDIYRLIAQTRNDHSKVTLFSKEEVVNFHSSDFLENVQRELGLSHTDRKLDDLQRNHTKMASLLFELTRPTTESSSKKLEIQLTGLQSCITKQWHTIQFLFRWRNSGKSLTPKGLQNHGNTCYFNSVMQCLLQTVSFSFELTLNLETLSKEFTLNKAYTELVSKYSDSEQRNTALNVLYCKFKCATPRFNDGRQHDSHDLLIHFLDKLRIEERYVCKSFPVVVEETAKMQIGVDRIFGGQFITVYTCHTCEEPYAIREPFLDISLPLCTSSTDEKKPEQGNGKSTTPNAYELHTPFSSKSASDQTSEQQNVSGTSKAGSKQKPPLAIDDNCGAFHRREVIENMMKTLIVEPTAKAEDKRFLPRIVSDFWSKAPNISQCLQYFTRAEEIDGEYLCRNCQPPGSDEPRLTSATKRILISSPPAILVLHLQRFEQKQIVGFVKRDEMIPYEELLDLGPFCSCSAQLIDPEEENVWYSLYAVVVHCGKFLSGGHYIAYVKERDSSAHLDDQVTDKFLQKKCAERENIPNDHDIATMEKRKKIACRWKAKRPVPIHGQWYYCGDKLVRPCDAKEAIDQKAFMLFYERIPCIVH